MKRILHSDWLPERAKWAYLAGSGFSAFFLQKAKFFSVIFCHTINPLLTKLVRCIYIYIYIYIYYHKDGLNILHCVKYSNSA